MHAIVSKTVMGDLSRRKRFDSIQSGELIRRDFITPGPTLCNEYGEPLPFASSEYWLTDCTGLLS